jgi:hypothetical protein
MGMSAEHGGHGQEEPRLVASSRERLQAMMEVVGKYVNSLANALLNILSLGTLNTFKEASESGHGHH